MAQNITSQITVVEGMTKEGIRAWINENLTVNSPCLIRTNFYSFFHCLLDNVESDSSILCGKDIPVSEETKELVKRNIVATKKKLEANMNFLLNSSIWVRFCDNGNWDGASDETKSNDIKLALEEFEWFNNLHLYEFKAAKEYIEYQLRAQNQNYLAEIGEHGVHITPMIYSDEVEFRNFFLGYKSSLPLKFKFMAHNEGEFYAEDVDLRILLVDDKISTRNDRENASSIKKCDDCTKCDKSDSCKLKVIRSLLRGEFIPEDKRGAFKQKTYWALSVESFVVNTTTIPEIWSIDKKNGKLKPNDVGEKINIENNVNANHGGVQIIGVRDLDTALCMMSFCKFDIILLDYLLGPRSNDDPTRTYSTELFEFLSYRFEKEEAVPEILEMLRKTSSFSDEQLKEFQNNVKLNRGPLDKFWIIPMTSYNSSFITDLQRKHVRLIDHRWNISQGADPINTPWKFLYKINEFVDLQLRSCVFHINELLEFLKYNCEDFDELSKSKNNKPDFYDFQSFMGAEFADFMRRYGNRHLIQRDAVTELGEKRTENKSLLSTCVWARFYNDRNYRTEIELNRLIQRFLHHVATMHNDRFGRQRLEEAFGQLCFFIESNKKVQKCIDKSDLFKGFHDSLRTMRSHMEGILYHSGGDL